MAALVLTVTLGTWLKAHEERSAPAASTDDAAQETPASDGSPTPVVSPDPGSLVRIDATTGEIIATVPMPFPTLVAADGRSVWVLSEGGARTRAKLVQVDAMNGGHPGTSDVSLPDALAGHGAVTALAAAGGSAWLSDDAGNVYRLAPGASALEPVTFAYGGLPNLVGNSLVGTSDSLWVSWFPPGGCCRPPPDLYRVDPATKGVLARIEDVWQVVASGTGFVWALRDNPLANAPLRLVRIDTQTHATDPIGVLEVNWAHLTVADGAVWASSPGDDTIVRLDPVTGEETERIRVVGMPGALAAGNGAVWAANGRSGTVARYDVESGRVETTDVGGTPNDLVFAHGSVWVTVDAITPADESQTVAQPGVAVIDQDFVDSINGCDRLLVTRREVKAALGFRTEDPAPTRSADGAFFGCEYTTSFDTRQGGGEVVITAYKAGGPPIPWEGSRPVRGIGDEAEFTPVGNADGHVDGPEGATSMLRVRSGDLILRFNGGVFDVAGGTWTPYGLPALRQLAEDTLVVGAGPAGAVAVAADYRFQDSLASSVGIGADLTNIGPSSNSFIDEVVLTRTRTVLTFPEGNGVSLSSTARVINSDRYTIELLFRFDRIDGYRKIIDFKNASDDPGLYSFDGKLNFFPNWLAARRTIEAGTYTQVVLTREASGKVAAYVNGVRQFSFRDVNGLAVIDSNDALRFFQDDGTTGGEHSAGAVSRIRLYDGPLNANEVEALACEEIPNAHCG